MVQTRNNCREKSCCQAISHMIAVKNKIVNNKIIATNALKEFGKLSSY